ncbi:DUF1428 family protein [Thalassobacillus sp. CUG 92003]|uniref:DUF1428 family protein n=1 Tax=Thalassobacillus sp. CUG 92003 TaxID=2736641 RepID=UPI0015E688EF|nr:DUF1428 family protein [Thalassobacillus sp. CUG 92003]
MFTVLYIVRVKEERLHEFLSLASKLGDIVASYGASETNICKGGLLTGRHGSLGLLNLMDVPDDERIYMAQVSFANEEEYKRVLEAIKTHDIAMHLYQQIKQVIDMNEVVSSTFTSASYQK